MKGHDLNGNPLSDTRDHVDTEAKNETRNCDTPCDVSQQERNNYGEEKKS